MTTTGVHSKHSLPVNTVEWLSMW
ncbi:unnamed protein product [Oppiella nova]|uniref:Uncharacterized protein n=1 Tax=Oppiella nova TaxID=334625 RepID=A0A7R9MR94_9ACAR|nr:unnamed protein product [Oppiella nova]CAG2181889.1 unnamed protein product [Oppiella nova]